MPRLLSFHRSAFPWGVLFAIGGAGLFAGLAGRVTADFLQSEMQRFLIPSISFFGFCGALTPLFRAESSREELTPMSVVSDALAVAGLWAIPLLSAMVLLARWWQGMDCFAPRELPNYALLLAISGASFAVLFHLVRFPLALWRQWPLLRFAILLLIIGGTAFKGPVWLPRLAADLAVRAERQKRLETFRRLTGRDPEDLAPDEERSLNGFDNPPASLAVAPNGFVWAAGGFQWYAGRYAPGLVRLTSRGQWDDSVPLYPNFPVMFSSPRLLTTPSGALYVNIGLAGGAAPTRLLPDGQVDPVYSTKGEEGEPRAYFPESMALQTDGKLVFSNSLRLEGVEPEVIVRLAPGGLPDEAFMSQANAAIRARWGDARPGRVAVAGDQKILLTITPSTGGVRLVRLTPDGALDDGFLSPPELSVRDFACAPDGGVYILAAPFPGKERSRSALLRLKADGRLDPVFSSMDRAHGARCLAVQRDGKILVGGRLKRAGDEEFGLQRFLPNGTLDPAFLPNGRRLRIDPLVTAICPLDDGGVLVAGRFTTPQNLYGRQMLTFLRLTPEGRWDTTYGLP